MRCNSCFAIHAAFPVQCIVCLAALVTQPLFSRPCGATHFQAPTLAQPMFTRPCRATHVQAPVGRNPSLAAFAAQRVFCRPCDATHVQPPMRPKPCLAVESGSRHTSSQAWVGPQVRLNAEYAVWACQHELRGMDC